MKGGQSSPTWWICRGTAASEDFEQTMIAPFSLPKLPARFYFKFGAPIRTSPEDLKDRTRCDDMYAYARNELQSGIDWLLEQRERDPYKDLGKRLFYEATWGGKQAPTFALPPTPSPSWTPLPPRKSAAKSDSHPAPSEEHVIKDHVSAEAASAGESVSPAASSHEDGQHAPHTSWKLQQQQTDVGGEVAVESTSKGGSPPREAMNDSSSKQDSAPSSVTGSETIHNAVQQNGKGSDHDEPAGSSSSSSQHASGNGLQRQVAQPAAGLSPDHVSTE